MSMDKVTTQEVVVRRSPKYLTFMVVGIILGLIVALILTVVFPNTSDFTLIQIFGYIAVFTGTIGGALGLIFALIFDRVMGKRTFTATAEHESVTKA